MTYRETGGNKLYPYPMSEAELVVAIAVGINDLKSWCHNTDRELDLSAITIDTRRVGDKVSVSVMADLVQKTKE